MSLSPDSLRELFFAQSIDGFFIMMLDEPIVWNDAADKDALLEHVFQHQRMTIVNEAYARQYRVSLEELIGKTPAEFFAHDIDAGKAGWRAMFDAGHLHTETDERRMDGTPVRIEGHYLCVYDEQGRITGHLGIQRDITDRHRAAEEIAASREQLRALAARLETIREEERTRIARELHDELGRIVIVDDHPIVRAGLRRIAEDDRGIVVTAEAESGDDALTTLRDHIADVVLLDVTMPGSPFTDTLRRLREEHPTVRVLVLSAHPEDQWAVRALRGGASGYLTKDHSPEQLLDAIRRVHRGGRYVSPTLAERLAAQLGRDFVRAPHEELSDREFDVLRGLGAGHTVKEIAAALGLSPKTVSTYRVRLMEKMGFATNADLVRYSAEHQLLFH